MSYFDLGTHHRRIATASAEAQLWFDRGLIWTYGYNHEEAIACFEAALEHDPGCVMAHWGIAYALGPNYNKPWESFDAEARAAEIGRAAAAARTAAALDPADPVERALAAAIARRFPEDPLVESFQPWHDAFAGAMREVHRAHPGDLDVAALFAEAIMNRTPWQLWDLRTGNPADGTGALEAVEVLETAFRSDPAAWRHPGLLHMYIHLMEMSPHPERALRHGDALSTLVPDAGHLLHMPTHIDLLCGDYRAVVERNARAIEADARFVSRAGVDNFYSVYRCHNLHFKVYGAMFLGQSEAALKAADALVAALPEPVLRPLADWFEGFIPIRQHVLVRFGRWEEILAQKLPEDAELYAVTTAMLRYARAIALANLGRLASAEAERDAFLAARDAVPASRMLFNNTCRDILGVAEAMLMGELEYHQGHHAAAFDQLRTAVARDDGLPYDEPWGWMQPARHALGALLLEQGRVAEAEAVYRADLGLDSTLARACQHPRNVWSLQGLHECLERRGETVEIAHIRQQRDQALARAEVPVHASCYCRHHVAA